MRHLGLSKKSGLPEYPEHDSFIAIKFLWFLPTILRKTLHQSFNRILMMTHKQLFGVIPIFRQIQLPKQKFGRPVIYPRAPQDLAATSCLTRLSKDPMANNPWVGQFAEAFLLEKEDELFVLADSGCLVFLFSFLYNKSHAFHMCIIHFRWNEW